MQNHTGIQIPGVHRFQSKLRQHRQRRDREKASARNTSYLVRLEFPRLCLAGQRLNLARDALKATAADVPYDRSNEPVPNSDHYVHIEGVVLPNKRAHPRSVHLACEGWKADHVMERRQTYQVRLRGIKTYVMVLRKVVLTAVTFGLCNQVHTQKSFNK